MRAREKERRGAQGRRAELALAGKSRKRAGREGRGGVVFIALAQAAEKEKVQVAHSA